MILRLKGQLKQGRVLCRDIIVIVKRVSAHHIFYQILAALAGYTALLLDASLEDVEELEV